MKYNSINKQRCVISVSSTDYKTFLGGTEKYIQDLENLYSDYEIQFLHIFVLAPLNHFMESKNLNNLNYFGILLNGKYLGFYKTQNLVDVLLTIANKKDLYFIGMTINSLASLRIDYVSQMISTMNLDVKMIVHDYSFVCDYYLNPDGFGPNCVSLKCEPGYELCKKCKYSSMAIDMFAKRKKFITDISQNLSGIIFPSMNTLKNWGSIYKIDANKLYVRPHFKYELTTNNHTLNDRIKIAYVGYPLPAKGFEAFKTLLNSIDSDYEFYYVGSFFSSIEDSRVNKVLADKNHKTTDQLEKENIDIVFLWSECPETYSYVYYESYAAGCYVITNNHSGNIKDAINVNNNGKVFDSLNDCIDYLNNKSLVENDLLEFSKSNKPVKLLPNDDFSLFEFKGNELKYDCHKKHKIYWVSILYRLLRWLIVHTKILDLINK